MLPHDTPIEWVMRVVAGLRYQDGMTITRYLELDLVIFASINDISFFLIIFVDVLDLVGREHIFGE